MEELFKIISHTQHNLRMSQDERVRLRAQLERHMREHDYLKKSPYQKIHSPFQQPSYWKHFQRRAVYALTSLLMVTVLGGTGLITAAEAALPGDRLYSVKVNFGEEVRSLLQLNPRDRTNWEIDRANRRLEEVKTLALSGRLDEETGAQATSYLSAHTAEAMQRANSLAKHDPEATEEARGRLEATLKTQAIVLDTIKETRKVDSLENVVASVSRNAETVDENREAAREAEPKTTKNPSPIIKFEKLQARLAAVQASELFTLPIVKETPPIDKESATDTIPEPAEETGVEEPEKDVTVEETGVDDEENPPAGEAETLEEQRDEVTGLDSITEPDQGLEPEVVTTTTAVPELNLPATIEEETTEISENTETASPELVITEPTAEVLEDVPSAPAEESTPVIKTPTDVRSVLTEKVRTMVTEASSLEADIATIIEAGDSAALTPVVEEFAQMIRELEQLVILIEELSNYTNEELAEVLEL